MFKLYNECEIIFWGINMEKPDLDMMWETYIRIGLPNVATIRRAEFFDLIRFRVSDAIDRLKNSSMIDWYCFLMHTRKSGVPTTEDDNNLYFHIRFTTKKKTELKDILDLLPNYCVLTRKTKRENVSKISMGQSRFIDESLFRSEGIEVAWRILGEQSEWGLKMLCAYKPNVKIPYNHIMQFFHYYFNMLFLTISKECPKCGNTLTIKI